MNAAIYFIGGFALFFLGCGAMYAFILGIKAEHHYARGHGFVESMKRAAGELK